MASIQGLLEALSELENSPANQGIEIRLSLADIVLRRLRELGMTQAELARKAGMKESFVNRIVHANSNCTFEVAGRLLFAVGVKAELVPESAKGQASANQNVRPISSAKGRRRGS